MPIFSLQGYFATLQISSSPNDGLLKAAGTSGLALSVALAAGVCGYNYLVRIRLRKVVQLMFNNQFTESGYSTVKELYVCLYSLPQSEW